MKKFLLATLILLSGIVHAKTFFLETAKTIDSDTTIKELNIRKKGTLTISKNVKLTLKQPSSIAGKLILYPGAKIEFNFATPGSLNILSGGLLEVKGTKAKPCLIYAKKGSAVAYISDGNSNGGGRITAIYCTFKNLGGKPLYRAYEYSPKADTGEIKLANCIFDSCYQVKAKCNLPKGSKVSFIKCKWQNSQVKPKADRGKWEEWFIHETPASPGSEAKLINCDFDKKIGFFHAADYIVEDCVFREGIKCYSHWNPKWKSFKRNFIRSIVEETEFAFAFGNKIEDCVFIKDHQGWNPHYIGVGNGQGKGGIYGSIFWYNGPGDHEKCGAEGDGVMPAKAQAGNRAENLFTLERNIVLPNKFGPYKPNDLSCTLLTILHKSPNTSVEVKRNTMFTTGIGGCNLGETKTCEKDRVIGIKSNLFIGNGTGKKAQNLGHALADALTAKTADYNAGFKLVDGSNYTKGSGKGYDNFKFTQPTILGKHDIDDIDPQLVDAKRTPFTWDKSLGGKGDMQGVMDQLSPGKGKKVIDLIEYIREGMRPQNKKLKGAGDPNDGSPDIGAVPVK